MTARTRKQFLLLGALAVAVAVIAFVQFREAPAERAGQPSNRTGREGSAERVAVPVVDLRLERLSAEHKTLENPERNPFRFRPPPPPPRAETSVAPRSEGFAPPPPTGPPPPPPIPLKFFGSADTNGTRIAWFSDARGNVMQGKEGDIIEGRYRVIRIGPDSAELAHLDGRGRQTIRLSGQ